MIRPAYQIPRAAMAWLLLSMVAAILPHLDRLPVWVSLVCLLCGCWRLMVYRGRWPLPSAWLRALLVFSGGAAVFAHYGTLAGPEAGSALLILGFCFKLMETHQQRDAFIVVILGYFVVSVSFFFDQSMLGAGYMLLVCVLVTTALLGLNQSSHNSHPKVTLMASSRLLLHALPVLLVLFVLVPRIGPIWSLDLGKHRAKTGLSEQMAPGDIAQLSRDDSLAFRVEFSEGTPVPPKNEWYWRALVLDQYDGHRWLRGPVNMDAEPMVRWRQNAPDIDQSPRRYRYRIVMEPTDQPWLFGLRWARSDDSGIGITRDHRLINRNPISQVFSYSVESIDLALDQPGLPLWLKRLNLQLPEGTDRRSRQWARQLREQAGSDEAFVQRVLAQFRQQPFSYTLSPPLLSGDRIDQFLFETRQGFCSHYAGAFVFLMRSVGIPARVVTGYQGGELNPLGNYLLVHQFDAHAWAEVWLPGRGWVRTDPTAYVAPERVERGLEEALASEQSFLADSPLSLLRYRQLSWLSRVRLGWDYVNFAWHRWVLGYDGRTQRQLFRSLFGQFDWRWLGGALLIAITLALSLLAFWLLRNSGPAPRPGVMAYQQICRKMARRGLALGAAESPGQYLQRLQRALPEKRRQLKEIEQLLNELLYRGRCQQQALVRQRQARLKRLISGI